MIIESCRSIDNPDKMIDRPGTDTTHIAYAYPENPRPTDIIMLVHGYNNEPSRAIAAYTEQAGRIYNHLPKKHGCEIMGFSWPSNGNALHYYRDICDAHDAGPRLATALAKYKEGNRLHVVTHSMGGEVIMHALMDDNCPYINTIVMMGADVPKKWMGRDKKYGKNCTLHQVARGLVMYSPSDGIVGTVARIVRPFVRLGASGLPDDAPINWIHTNAETLHGAEVNHNTYRESDGVAKAIAGEILAHTAFSGKGGV